MCWSSKLYVSCRAAEEKEFLSHNAREKHAAGQSRLQKFVRETMATLNQDSSELDEERETSEKSKELPVVNVMMADGVLQKLNFSSFLQGPQIL